MKCMIAVCFALCACLAASTAEAAFQITLSAAGFSDIVVVDGSVDDFDTRTGFISYSNDNFFGGYNLSYNATALPPSGGLTAAGFGAGVTQQALRLVGTGNGSPALSITALPDPFTFGAPGVYNITNALGSSALTSGATASAVTNLNGAPTPLATIVGAGAIAANASSSALLTSVSSSFMLSNTLTISGLAAGGLAELTLSSTAVIPEPTALALISLGLPAFALVRRRSRS